MVERVADEAIRKVKESVDLAALFEADGSVLERDGALMKTKCPFHADGAPSLALYPNQTYYCFGCSASGDQIAYVMKRRGRSFLDALADLGAAPVLARPAKIDKRREWDPIIPIPDSAPKFHGASRALGGEPIGTWWYLSALGARLMVDARYQITPDQKTMRTWCWARNSEGITQWRCTRPSDNLPLYGLHRLKVNDDQADQRAIVLNEGAKKSDAAQLLWPGMVSMAWCGGSKNAKRPAHDLRPLKGRNLILLSDYDKVGVYAMWWMAKHARDAGVASVQAFDLCGLQEFNLPQGWDVVDGKPEDHWDSRLLARLAAPEKTDEVLRAMMRELPGEIDPRALAEVLGSPPAAGSIPVSAGEPEMGDGGEDAAGEPDSGAPAGGGAEPPGVAPAAAEGEGEKPDPVERSDIANATRFVSMHSKVLRWCAVYGRWHHWDGRVWAPGQTGDGKANAIVMPMAETTAKAIAAEYLEKSGECFEAAKGEQDEWKAKDLKARGGRWAAKAEQIQSRKKLLDMVELAKSRPGICVEPAQLDAHEHLLTCLNGVIDLKSGKLRAHNPTWLLTQLCPVEFDPKADTTLLLKVVEHVCNGDQAVVAFVQQVLGRSLFANNALEKFYVWCGPGGSGKGTLMEAMKAAIGISCMTAEFQSFVRTQGRQVRDDLARLAEARVVLAAEVEKGEALAAGVLKSITGNDTVTSRHLYGTYFEFRPKMTLHLQCNSLPRVDDEDSGVWRRLTLIPCGAALTEEQRDPSVKARLFDPQEGGKAILAWMVAGAVKAAKLQFIPEPESVKAASAKYRATNNPVRGFLQDAVRLADAEHHEKTWILVREMAKVYHAYCDEIYLDRRLRLSEKHLGDRLEALGCYRKKHKAVVDGKGPLAVSESCWFGITVLDNKLTHLLQPAGRQSFVPSDEAHELALQAVPGFLGSWVPEKSSRVSAPASERAHPPTRTRAQENTFPILKNSGTEEPDQGPNADPDDGPGIDLSELGDH